MNRGFLSLFLLPIYMPFLLSTAKGSPATVVDCSQSSTSSCSLQTLNISFPFSGPDQAEYCGLPEYRLSCSGGEPTILFGSRRYRVKRIDYALRVVTVAEMDYVLRDVCPWHLGNTTLDPALFDLAFGNEKLVLFRCSSPPSAPTLRPLTRLDCSSYTYNKSELWYYYYKKGEEEQVRDGWPASCDPPVVIPLRRKAVEELPSTPTVEKFRATLSQGFDVQWKVPFEWCTNCSHSNESCDHNMLKCFCPNSTHLWPCSSNSEGSNWKLTRKLLVAFGSSVGGFLLALGVVYLLLRRQKGNTRSVSRKALVRSGSTDPSPSDTDLEALGSFYQTLIFTYEELQEATGGFDSSKELGDGGFGVVYKGFLKDGRVVAVKRLHERNYRRVQQFRNEVEILNRIRHPNLVSLYGCTTRDSRELLLVYEYVPNGTLADHLNGPLASENLLTWPRRFSIAVETAAALAYLHATQPQIIHRDIKTSNILLDNAFHVKVADFGLSRLFPSGMATHVTTAPQGTPGYVDPEYHQCYQLTDKSDVYSFGVVLVELISSKPAVDIDRPRSEINLSNIAMAKIPRGLVHELVDPTLGYDTDPGVKQAIDAMAELAFRCLQPEKDMRPSMDEVRETLVQMDGDQRKAPPESEFQTRDDASLLKSSESAAFSPVTVIGNWSSISTNHSASS